MRRRSCVGVFRRDASSTASMAGTRHPSCSGRRAPLLLTLAGTFCAVSNRLRRHTGHSTSHHSHGRGSHTVAGICAGCRRSNANVRMPNLRHEDHSADAARTMTGSRHADTRSPDHFLAPFSDDFAQRAGSVDMPAPHHRLPGNARTIIGKDSIADYAEAGRLEFGRKFSGGHLGDG
jgi:hypothetical protein